MSADGEILTFKNEEIFNASVFELEKNTTMQIDGCVLNTANLYLHSGNFESSHNAYVLLREMVGVKGEFHNDFFERGTIKINAAYFFESVFDGTCFGEGDVALYECNLKCVLFDGPGVSLCCARKCVFRDVRWNNDKTFHLASLDDSVFIFADHERAEVFKKVLEEQNALGNYKIVKLAESI